MTLFFWLALVILFVCLINYGVDYAFYLKDKYSRFHIGRWDRERWKTAIEYKAVRWLNKTPVVKITDNSRYMLLDFLSGKYKSHTIQSWQKAALILGLLESTDSDSVEKAKKAAASLLGEDGSWRRKPTRVDCGMLSLAVMKAAEDPIKIDDRVD